MKTYPYARFSDRGLLIATIVTFVIGAAAVTELFTGCVAGPPTSARRPNFMTISQDPITGTSMLPKYAPGDRYIIEVCRYRDLSGGNDVMRWDWFQGGFALHQLRHRNDTGWWVTRGLSNWEDDPIPMGPDDFVVRVHQLPREVAGGSGVAATQ